MSCEKLVYSLTLDYTWRDGDGTEIETSAWQILNSTLFGKTDIDNVWVDEMGCYVKITDPENLKVTYRTVTE